MGQVNLNEIKIKKALSWFKKKLKKASDKKKPSKGELASLDDVGKKMRMFHLYAHVYSAKYKDTLEVWDAFPLYFPIDVKGSKHGSGAKIHALNIHYLKPADRIKFIGEIKAILIKEAEKGGYDVEELEDLNAIALGKITKVVGKYINKVYMSGGGSAGRNIRAAYRSYLFSNIKSKITKIKISEWEKAAMAILPAFRKMGPAGAYKHTQDQYNKYKKNPRKPIY